MRHCILTLVGFIFLTSPSLLAQAQDRRCIVTDPTGTPLNVRNVPNGRVVSTLENGTEVHIEELSSDPRGRSGVHPKNETTS